MNAETEGDAESPKRRGRIPQSAWPRILERYKAGATLSAIAREFDCTPSAISYIVRKAEAAGLTSEGDEVVETAPPAPAPVQVVAPPAPVDAPRPRRAPRATEVRAAEAPVEEAVAAKAAPAPATVTQVTAAPAPAAAEASEEPAVAEPVSGEPARGSPFQHDSGRHGEVPRRFEARESRPPRENREGRPERSDRFNQDPREQRPDREPRIEREPRPDREPRQDREFRGEPRQDREPRPDRGPQQGDRRPPQGNLRFPQGGQQGPQRDRFAERPQRERLEARPPRDFDRDRNSGNDRSGMDRPSADYNPAEGPAEVVYPYRQQQRNPARLEAAETPTAPADERMDTAAKTCAEAYKAWKGQAGGDVQGLTDALHELRKVIARMEIEISASRKEELRPIAFPSYRTNLPPPQQPRG